MFNLKIFRDRMILLSGIYVTQEDIYRGLGFYIYDLLPSRVIFRMVIQ